MQNLRGSEYFQYPLYISSRLLLATEKDFVSARVPERLVFLSFHCTFLHLIWFCLSLRRRSSFCARKTDRKTIKITLLVKLSWEKRPQLIPMSWIFHNACMERRGTGAEERGGGTFRKERAACIKFLKLTRSSENTNKNRKMCLIYNWN